MSDTDDSPSQPTSAFEELPAAVSLGSAFSHALRLLARKALPLVAAFIVAYGVGIAIGIVTRNIDGPAGEAAAIGVQILLGIGPAFACAFGALILADEVAQRSTSYRDVFATLRVHARHFFLAGLLATVMGLPLNLILPFISVVLIGPPIVIQVAALEYRTFIESLRRTADLLRGRWGRTGTYMLLLTIVMLLLFYTFFIYALPLIGPFVCAFSFVLYLDLRVRSEDLDAASFVEEREAAMGERGVGDSIPG